MQHATESCPLCTIAFAPQDRERRSLRALMEERAIKPTFTGDGPTMHRSCFLSPTFRAKVQGLIKSQPIQAESATSTTAPPPMAARPATA